VSPEYFDWRYCRIPGFRYHALWEGDAGRGALVVLRTRRRGAVEEIRVCDLLVGPLSGAARSLRTVLRRAARAADANVMLAMAPGRPHFRGALLRAGFLPVPRSGPILTAYPLRDAPGHPDPTQLDSWGATIGDLELF
jgi:hypothetical protein